MAGLDTEHSTHCTYNTEQESNLISDGEEELFQGRRVLFAEERFISAKHYNLPFTAGSGRRQRAPLGVVNTNHLLTISGVQGCTTKGGWRQSATQAVKS